MSELSNAYFELGKLDQSLELGVKAVQSMKTKLPPGDESTRRAMGNLSSTYYYAGMRKESVALAEERVKVTEEKLGPNDPETLTAIVHLVELSGLATNLINAESWIGSLLMRLKQCNEPTKTISGDALISLLQFLLDRQQWATAELVGRECMGIWEKKQPDQAHAFLYRSLLGGALLGQHKFKEAEPLI